MHELDTSPKLAPVSEELWDRDISNLPEIFSRAGAAHPAITFITAFEPWRRVTVSVARVSSQHDTLAHNEETTLGDLFDALREAPFGAKEGSAILQGAVAVSPGSRKNADVRKMWGFGFDLDNVERSALRRVMRRLRDAGVAFTIHPTWSCGLPEKGACYRIWIPLKEPAIVDGSSWAKAYRATGRYFEMPFDEACTNTARLLFLPRREEGRAYPKPRHFIGDALSFNQLLRLAEHYEETSKSDGEERARRRRPLLKSLRSEERSRFDAFWTEFRQDFLLADLALAVGENAREVAQGENGGSKVTCRCPLEDEHRSPDGPNATPLVAFNPGDAEHQTATAKCLHATHKETSSCDLAWAFIGDSGAGTWREFLVEDAHSHFDAWLMTQPATRQDLDEAFESLRSHYANNTSLRTHPDNVTAVMAVVEKIASRKNDPRRVADTEILAAICGWSKTNLRDAIKNAAAGFEQKRASVAANRSDTEEERDDILLSTADYAVNVDKLMRCFQRRNVEDPPLVFIQGGTRPVRLVRPDGRWVLQGMNETGHWQVALDRVATYRKVLRTSIRGAAIPDDLIRAIRASPDLSLPPLDSVITIPIFDSNGELVRKRGYTRSLRAFYEPFADIQMPDDISISDVRAAVDLLFDVLRDVPFSDAFGEDADTLPMYEIGPDGNPARDGDGHLIPNLERGRSSRLHFLSSVITPFILPMLGDANIPAYHYDKATPGSGASLLLNLRAIIETGRNAVTLTLTDNNEETRKNITTQLGEGAATICYDNIKEGTIDSAPLAKLITDGTWSDRALGTNKSIEVKFRGTIILAGNALSFSKELLRRNIPVRLDAAVENPQFRKGFKYEGVDGLCKHVFAHRTELVRAILVLVQWWIDCGRPSGIKSVGSFEAWCSTLGGIFETAGLEGFLDSLGSYTGGMADDDGGEAYSIASQLYGKHKEFPFGADDIWTVQGGISATPPSRKDLQSVGIWATKALIGKTFNMSGVAVQLRKTKTNAGTKYKFARVSRDG